MLSRDLKDYNEYRIHKASLKYNCMLMYKDSFKYRDKLDNFYMKFENDLAIELNSLEQDNQK